MNNRQKKLFLIFTLFLILIGIIFLYYFLGYGVIGYKTSKQDCKKIEEDAYKKATEALQKENFDSIAVKNLCHYQMFGKFILKNKIIIETYNKNNRRYSGNSLSYFPENIRNEAEKLWIKCNTNKYIYGKCEI